MKLKIFVDSSCGIEENEAKTIGIEIFPLRFYFGEKEYYDGVDISKDEFYKLLTSDRVFPKTSLPNLYNVKALVQKYIKDDYKVIILTLSSLLSGTFSSLYSMFIEEENVKVIDSTTTVAGLRFLINEAKKYEDLPLEEIEIKLNNLKRRIRIVAGVDTLEYLYRGGRLSKVASIVGNIIGLKPIIGVIDGRVSLLAKKRGKKHVMQCISELPSFLNLDSSYPVYGLYSMNRQNYDELTKFIPSANILNIATIDNIAPVIGCHIGPNAYGICYVEKE